jgi:hypothetical protein
MIDLYLLIVAGVALLSILNLIALKLAVKDNVNLCKIREKHPEANVKDTLNVA